MSTHRAGHIDRDTAERMLTGARRGTRSGGSDPLVALLTLAAAPAGDHELGGEQAAMAAFRAARLASAVQPRRPSMTKAMLAKLLTLKAAAVLAATAAGGVALAASTGTLPNPMDTTRHTTQSSGDGHVGGRPSARPSHPGETDRPDGTPSPSLVGLCHAYLAGAGSEHGKALESPAFTVLITKAGGKDKVDAFCTALLASAAPSQAGDGGNGDGGNGEHGRPSGRPTPSHPNGAPASHPGH